MKNTLYVTDLDGTLMNDDKQLSEYTVKTLNKLIKDGLLITYATARTIRSSSKITSEVDFILPVINRNGTVLSDPKTKKSISIKCFNSEELREISKYVAKYKIPGFITAYINNKETKTYLLERMNPGFEKYLDSHRDDKRINGVSEESELYKGDVCYFTFIADKEELMPFYNSVKDDERWNCVFQKDKYDSEFWLEIIPKTATKASAIQQLKKQFNCDKVVVFGDSLNDISMFEIADESYAVGNGMEEIKKIATGILEDNNHDGVVKFLENL